MRIKFSEGVGVGKFYLESWLSVRKASESKWGSVRKENEGRRGDCALEIGEAGAITGPTSHCVQTVVYSIPFLPKNVRRNTSRPRRT